MSTAFATTDELTALMHTIEAGPLFNIRFRLRTVLCVVTAFCLLLALGPPLFELTFLLFCVALSAYAVWLATRSTPRYLGLLIVWQLAIATFLFVGPILSYHLNGRAWYDYGLSTWNPPVSRFSDGRIGIYDYDPKYTPPAVWPVIGPIMYIMCWLSGSLIFFPPTSLIVSIASFNLAVRLRHVLTERQMLVAWMTWVIGILPTLYMFFWGGHVIEWIAD